MNIKPLFASPIRQVGRLTFAAVTLTAGFVVFSASSADAAEPGWSPVIIATGEYRQQIESMPIEMRPYRPLHFYGNTVRRNYYRGTPIPTPRAEVRTMSRSSGFIRGR